MSARKRKIVYIVGLAHSGSTVLDMLLTTGGKAVGLGQVWTVVHQAPGWGKDRVCSCGAAAPDCPIWGPALLRLGQLSPGASAANRYQIVLESVDCLYGEATTIVDSSKHAEYLAMLNEMPAIELAVLHNMKDVRPFTISTLDNSLRKGARRELPEKIFYQWYRDNRAGIALVSRLLGRAAIRVTYEELCLSTEAAAARLGEALGESYIDTDAALDAGRTHIIAGNRLRLPENGKAKQLEYDHRWFARHEWLRPYILMPMVRKYNEQCMHGLRSVVEAASFRHAGDGS
jgi:hypothetical protein